MKRFAALAGVVAAAPATALACPQCAGREGNAWVVALLGSFMVLPFVLAYIVYKVARRTAAHPPTWSLPGDPE